MTAHARCVRFFCAFFLFFCGAVLPVCPPWDGSCPDTPQQNGTGKTFSRVGLSGPVPFVFRRVMPALDRRVSTVPARAALFSLSVPRRARTRARVFSRSPAMRLR